MAQAPNSTAIFHITPIQNLGAILATGELRAKSVLGSTNYTNIAHQNIQDQRANQSVPLAPRGVLHDYVPFYFAPRSPMLYVIHKGNVQEFAGKQQSIVYLVSAAQSVQAEGLDFVFTDGHGIMEFTIFYDNLAGLNQVDWPLMKARYWHDTGKDPDRKRRRQAEFLVHQRLPIQLIQGIGVFDQQMKNQVKMLITQHGLNIPVAIKRSWYY